MNIQSFPSRAGSAARHILNDSLSKVTTAERVEQLNALDIEEAAELLGNMPQQKALRIIARPELSHAADILAAMPVEQSAKLLKATAHDRVADIFQAMEERKRGVIFGRLDPLTAKAVSHLMTYPQRTAGSIMTTEFVSVPDTMTVGETLDHVKKVENASETVYAIYVLDHETHCLTGVVTLRRLITGDQNASILTLTRREGMVSASPFMAQEDVARLIRKNNLLALPVVDDNQQMLGIVTVDDVIDTMIADTTEDAQKFGGMEALGKPYMQIGFASMIKKRAGWLCALFLGEMLTASAMQHFETELEKAVVLTLFIPLIMSSGGNSGSQATSLIIRALAVGELKLSDWWRVALRELPTGVTLGAILGLVGFARISLWQHLGLYDYGPHWIMIGFTVFAALIGIVLFGSMAGSMLPFILQKLRLDPASASAPFVATLVDVSGLVIYFTVALAILSGTLL
ncbi:magnesium transporter [Allorhizobium sp. BGMRC 0089]|uniref:magnesium transporter n=1 Tax=Allorhizobium sonneratiae TaxID=2934936 RepID=UPI0020333BDB|nr:magnesium transporter [Allorhizobium sonneratiae]MCM2291946.1 magnesium transporter [Allorhizobium sonneratiae]